MRITKSSTTLPAVERGRKIKVFVDGVVMDAYDGEMISTVLMANGIRVYSHSLTLGRPKGMFCGMGICYECLVTINGDLKVRACQTPVKEGMVIDTGKEAK